MANTGCYCGNPNCTLFDLTSKKNLISYETIFVKDKTRTITVYRSPRDLKSDPLELPEELID